MLYPGSVVPLAIFSKLVTIMFVWWVTKIERGCWAWYMGHTSKWQIWVQWSHFWRLLVSVDFVGQSTKLIIIFIIELGIWVIRASGNLGCCSFGVIITLLWLTWKGTQTGLKVRLKGLFLFTLRLLSNFTLPPVLLKVSIVSLTMPCQWALSQALWIFSQKCLAKDYT